MIPITLLTTLALNNDFKADAEQLSSRVEQLFWNGSAGHYAAYVTDAGQPSKEPAFAWDMAVQMSALAAACQVFPRHYQPLYDKAFASLRTYGSVYQDVFGYGVLPGNFPPDRFYDDNAWIALAQLDAYEALHTGRYLDDAKRTFMFVMSGASTDLQGGLFWREKEKHSKNTCTNAPAITAAARLYLFTKDQKYLKIAERLHQWLQRLKDTDNLMSDNIDLAGKIDKTKWTYNTALMIRGDLMLYRATKEQNYLDEAIAMGTAAVAHWVDPTTGAIHDEASFAHHLSEAFLDLQEFDSTRGWRDIALKATTQAYQLGSNAGFFGLRWDKYEIRDHRLILLYQASMERALWMAARP